MSGRAVHRVLRDGPPDPRVRMVLVVIADWMDPDGRNAKVGIRTIAERAGLSEGTAQRLKRQAIEEGFLIVDKPGDGGGAAVYSLGPAFWLDPDLAPNLARGAPNGYGDWRELAPNP